METVLNLRRRALPRWTVALSGAVLFLSACNRMDDTNTNYKKAIDKYYSTHPSCLWREPVRFPMTPDSGDAKAVAQYNALADQKLLTKAGSAMRVSDAGQEAAAGFDLTPKGKEEWVADSDQPGYGNICYGHRKTVSIDSATPTSAAEGATTTVVYRYKLQDVPSWAKNSVIESAFSDLQADLSGREMGRATLTDTKKGWVVTEAPWAHIDDSDIYR